MMKIFQKQNWKLEVNIHRMVQLPRALLVAQRVSEGKREAVKIKNCIKLSTVRLWWRKKRNHENEKPLTIVSKRESVHSEALLGEKKSSRNLTVHPLL